MSGVLTCTAGAAWESTLVSALAAPGSALQIARRCVDIADLLAEAETGIAAVAVIASGQRHLDTDCLRRLARAGVASIVVHPASAAADRGRWVQMGADSVLGDDSPVEEIIEAAAAAARVHRTTQSSASWSDPRITPHSSAVPAAPDLGPVASPSGGGRIVAVWGPTGAPGRTTVASGLAVAAAATGCPSLLIDADVYGGVLASAFGLLQENPGLAGACRTAGQGRLDPAALSALCWTVGDRLRLLTGIARPDRWPELRPSAIPAVLSVARGLAGLTVVDCGFCIEADEELSYDTVAPRRNGTTLEVLAAADLVIAVGAADPPGMERLVQAMADLTELVQPAGVRVVLNRVRRSAAGVAEAEAALRRFTGFSVLGTLPEDRATVDRAWRDGVPVARAAAGSALAKGFTSLAQDLLGDPAIHARRHR